MIQYVFSSFLFRSSIICKNLSWVFTNISPTNYIPLLFHYILLCLVYTSSNL
nr:MAG TPA: hypothetical protein [Crassvirales sp.]